MYNNEKTQNKKKLCSFADIFGTSQDGNAGVSCHICWKVFQGKRSLSAHIRDIHADTDQKFNCHLCNRLFKSINTLRNHKSLYHKGEK